MALSAREGLGAIINEYLEIILNSVQENKILILDKYTTGVVAQVKGQTEMLDMGVYLFNQLGRRPETASDVTHLEAIVLIRPTRENITLLEQELRKPSHKSYHIFFSNVLPDGYLSRLAEADDYELVAQVKEVFMDFVPINHDLWNLRLPNSFSLMNDSMGSARVYDYHVHSLTSVLLATKLRPVIRYDKNSPICKRLAMDVQKSMDRNSELFSWEQNNEPLLLVLDRRQDPVTPLLTQWHYQAMTHELLTINNSRVDLKESSNTDLEEVVLNTFADDFYERHQMSNFGDLGVAVKDLVEAYSTKRGEHSNIESIEDMQKFVEGYGEYMQASTAVAKHVGVLTELSSQVAQRNLLEISALEQDIATSQNMSKHYDKITSFIANPSIDDGDLLRLVILYALRYESSKNNNLPRLREQLRHRHGGRAAKNVRFVDLILNTCGKRFRTGDLFNNESTSSRLMSALKGLKGVENIYTQHTPYLDKILGNALANSLSQANYPFVDRGRGGVPTNILVFIVGGATYEEAMLVRSKSKGRTNILLGGSCIHNSRTFMADVHNASSYNIQSEDYSAVDIDANGEPDLI